MVTLKKGAIIEEESSIDKFLKKRKNQKKIVVTEGKDTINRKGRSFHKVKGSARDVRTSNLSSGEKKNMIDDAKAKGFFALDEGDHIHLDVGGNLPKKDRGNIQEALKEDKRGVLARGKDVTDMANNRFTDDLTSLDSMMIQKEKERDEDQAAKLAASHLPEDGMAQQIGGAVLTQTESGQREVASASEALPENVRRTVVEEAKNPDKVTQSIQRSKQGKATGSDASIKDNFMDAVSFFLPTAIGALAGGALGGTEGALQGAKDATNLASGFRSHQLKKEELAIKRGDKLNALKPKAVKHQQSDFVDKKGDPLTFNPETNEYVKSDGSKAVAGDFKDPIDARQARSLVLRARSVKVSEIKAKHQIAKDTQLSDKQVEKLESMNTVLDSVDRIEEIQQDVSTGLGRGLFQSMAEFADAAPAQFTELKSETNSALAAYVKSISGAQVSELEAQRLKNIIPDIGDAPDVFDAKLKTFRRIVKANKKAFKNAIISGQPLKAGTIIGLDKAEKDNAKNKAASSKDKINAMSPEKKKRYEAFKARNK